jgi:hypothetical protein
MGKYIRISSKNNNNRLGELINIKNNKFIRFLIRIELDIE